MSLDCLNVTVDLVTLETVCGVMVGFQCIFISKLSLICFGRTLYTGFASSPSTRKVSLCFMLRNLRIELKDLFCKKAQKQQTSQKCSRSTNPCYLFVLVVLPIHLLFIIFNFLPFISHSVIYRQTDIRKFI